MSHRLGILNSKAFEDTLELWPNYIEAANKGQGGNMINSGERGLQKASAIRSELKDRWVGLPSSTQFSAGYINGSGELWEKGVTQLSTRIDWGRQVTPYYALAREEGRLPYRAGWHYAQHNSPQTTPSAARDLYPTMGAQHMRIEDSNPWLWEDGVGVGGGGDSAGRACLGPDLDPLPEHEDVKEEIEACPDYLTGEGEGSEANQAVVNALRAGWRTTGLHGHGSHMIRLFARLIEDLMEEEPDLTLDRVRANRYGFAHGTMVGKVPEVMELMRELNFHVSVNFNKAVEEEPPTIREFYGDKGFEFMAPVKSLIEEDVHVNAERADFQELSTYVNRIEPETGEVLQPDERIDRVTAFKLMGIKNADFNLSDNQTGSLEEGKFADFIAIDRDFLDQNAVPDEEIEDIQVLMTVVGDEVHWVHEDAPEEWKDREYAWGDWWFEEANEEVVDVKTTEKPKELEE